MALLDSDEEEDGACQTDEDGDGAECGPEDDDVLSGTGSSVRKPKRSQKDAAEMAIQNAETLEQALPPLQSDELVPSLFTAAKSSTKRI
eukprot:1733255-Pyramimonas_sp.AAC.1